MQAVDICALESFIHVRICSIFPVKSWLITNILKSVKPKLSLSMWASVVAVSAVLLALIRLFSSFTTVKQRPGTVLPPCGKTWLLQNNFSAHVRPERTKNMRGYKNRVGARTVCTYCSDDAIRVTHTVRCPRVRVKSEVYFGLKICNVIICMWHPDEGLWAATL